MKRAVVFVVLGGLSLASAIAGSLSLLPAHAAELDGFAINTQDKDKAVTITLFTDQRVPYSTEHQGKQFTIVLPNTQISPEQLTNGLPVVVDNKNRFIGRAVPTEDGKVKIILPNLPASDYAVSIQQKHAVPVKASGDSAAKPRPATNMGGSNGFEQAVANHIPKATQQRISLNGNPDGRAIHLSPPIHPVIERGPNTKNIIWNPYATKAPQMPVVHETPASSKPAAISAEPIHLNHVAAETGQPPVFPETALPPSNLNLRPAQPVQDSLWYLHSLPPSNPSALPATDLKTLAAQDAQLNKLMAAAAKATQEEAKPAPVAPRPGSYTHGLLQELKASFKSIPQWLLITLAVFLGGIGVFTLFGGLMLLKILFVQARTQAFTQPLNIVLPTADALAAANGQPTEEAKPYGSRPAMNRNQRYDFEDTSSISALDYLKGSPDSVTTAVHNATLLKFPTQRKHRSNFKKPADKSASSIPAYRLHP